MTAAIWSGQICALAVSGFLACQITPALADRDDSGEAQVDKSYPHAQPAYPENAQLSGEQGTVVLHVRLSANGRVRSILVEKSSGFEDLDVAAAEGVFRWRFTPQSSEGRVTIVYRLPTLPSSPAPGGPK